MKKSKSAFKTKKKLIFHSLSAISFALSLVFSGSAQSYTIHTVYDLDGNPYLDLLVYEAPETVLDFGINPADYDFSVEEYPTRNLRADEFKGIDNAMAYIASVFGKPVHKPVIHVFGSPPKESNAAADSQKTPEGEQLVKEAYLGRIDPQDDFSGFIMLANTVTYQNPVAKPIAPLPQQGTDFDLTSAVAHEMMHALGVGAYSPVFYHDGNMAFGAKSNAWQNLLRDINGQSPSANKPIRIVDVANLDSYQKPDDADKYFTVIGKDAMSGIYFAGDHVIETLKGKYAGSKNTIPSIYYADTTIVQNGTLVEPKLENSVTGGIPVNGFEGYEKKTDKSYLELSHIELQNSLLSHQVWRNWGTFMEAELAAMKDLGYPIDLKRFFGTSVYESDNSDIVINQAFTSRNNGRWTESASTQPWAIGTHIYGSLNKVSIEANQLADGYSSIGVRVDGVQNTLTVLKDTLISAEGENGMGIAVTYGRDHTLVIDEGSAVSATGTNARAISFDMGSGALGDCHEYRGSWTVGENKGQGWKSAIDVYDSINSYLVRDVQINGKVTAGSGGVAIYIAPNASVKQISVGKTAEITGDIVSLWNAQGKVVDGQQIAEHSVYKGLLTYVDSTVDLTTNLIFNGTAYAGNILGQDCIRLTIASDTQRAATTQNSLTVLSGVSQVLGVTVKRGATLTGGGTFILTPAQDADTFARVPDLDFKQQTFVNDGKLISSPATGTTYIDGNYTQSEGATLTVGIDGEGNLLGLGVTGTVTLDGESVNIGLIPSGYFKSGAIVATKDVHGSPIIGQDVGISNAVYKFDDSVNYDGLSKTLDFKLENNTLTVTRQTGAYGRVLATAQMPTWQREIVSILETNANTVTDRDAQALIADLDFSTGQGIAHKISGLGGDAHIMSVRSHFAMERLLDRTFAFAYLDPASEGKSVWMQPFGGKVSEYFDEGTADTDTAGLAGGVMLQTQSGTMGWHLATAYMKSDDTTGGKTQSEGLWLGGQTKTYPYNDTWFVEGSARLGVINSNTERRLERHTLKTDGILYSLSASAKVGAEIDVGKVELAPIAGLTATMLRTPSDTESGISALDIESRWYVSVRSQLGLKASTAYLLSQFAGYSWKWNLYAMYEHELTDDAGDFKAELKGMHGTFAREVTFNDKSRYLAGISLGLFNETGFSASLRLDTEMTHGNGSAVTGSAQLRWKF